MSLNPETIQAAKTPKRAIPGIGPTTNNARLISVLERLGLCPTRIAEPLKDLAAAGKPLKPWFTVSVWDLDRALAEIECTVDQRMGFKVSLDRAGLLTVPKV